MVDFPASYVSFREGSNLWVGSIPSFILQWWQEKGSLEIPEPKNALVILMVTIASWVGGVNPIEPRKKPFYFPLYWLVNRDP